MAKYVKLFSTLELLISTHKKTSKCGDPTNITPWECCHLYSKSSSPIKLIKSYGEYLFLYKMAKYGQIFSVLDLFTTISKRPQNVENPFFMLLFMILDTCNTSTQSLMQIEDFLPTKINAGLIWTWTCFWWAVLKM